MAALGELHRHAFGAADGDRARRRPACACAASPIGEQLARDHDVEALAQADVGEDFLRDLRAGVLAAACPSAPSLTFCAGSPERGAAPG